MAAVVMSLQGCGDEETSTDSTAKVTCSSSAVESCIASWQDKCGTDLALVNDGNSAFDLAPSYFFPFKAFLRTIIVLAKAFL